MGLRVRILLAVLSLLTIGALAVPLALSLADRRTASLAEERGRQLEALADSAAAFGAPLQSLVDRYHEVYGEGVLIVDSDGHVLAERGLGTADPGVDTATYRALVNAPAARWKRILPWHRHRVVVSEGVRRGGELVGAVVVAVDTTTATRDITYAWLWVALGGIALLILAVLVARTLTRWVVRPLDGLERSVTEMREGVAGPPADVGGPPELRRFTSAFNTMAQVVRAALDRQQRLVADASHQLRNPLAALRLRADTLDDYVSHAGRATYGSMTTELDRLENLLRQLLRLARAEETSDSRKVGLLTAADEVTNLDEVVQQRITFWQDVAHAKNQRLRHLDDHAGLSVRLSRHNVEQLLDVALDNALRYAGPHTTVTASVSKRGETVDLVISDDGCGLPDEELAHAAARFWRGRDDTDGTGLGLAIATEIAAGHGGAMSVEHAPEGGLLVRYTLRAAAELS
jgi:signal transduction histidine kinase